MNWITLDLDAFRYLLLRKFWLDLWDKINRDDCWGMAARLSYYFLLAFFPFLIFLSALIGFLPIDLELIDRILIELDRFLPERTYTWMRELTIDLVGAKSSGILSIGLVLTLWWASAGLNGMVGALNRAYNMHETRRYVKVRLLAIGTTLLLSGFVIASGIFLLFGDWLIRFLSNWITSLPYSALGGYAQFAFSAARWTFVFLLMNFAIQMVYCILPVRRIPWTLLSPGSIAAVSGWVVGSQGFAFYMNRFADFETYQKLYGSLGALIVLMLWFYLGSFVLLVGGEINSKIARLREAET